MVRVWGKGGSGVSTAMNLEEWSAKPKADANRDAVAADQAVMAESRSGRFGGVVVRTCTFHIWLAVQEKE